MVKLEKFGIEILTQQLRGAIGDEARIDSFVIGKQVTRQQASAPRNIPVSASVVLFSLKLLACNKSQKS